MFRIIGREFLRLVICAIAAFLIYLLVKNKGWLNGEDFKVLFELGVSVLGCIAFVVLYLFSFLVSILIIKLRRYSSEEMEEKKKEFEAEKKELLAKIKDLEQQVESKKNHIIKQNEKIHTLQELVDLKHDQSGI